MQMITTLLEAKILCDFYDYRYRIFSKNISDLDESKKQFDRSLILIKDVSNEQKDFFETLGMIQTCFKMDNELENVIDEIYNFKTIDIIDFSNFKTEKELNEDFSRLTKSIEPTIKKQYDEKINKLIKLLKSKLE